MTNAEKRKKWRRRQRILNYVRSHKVEKGCILCGYKEDTNLLQFHHIDPNTKLANVSDLIARSRSFATVMREIDKCVVVCSTCHVKIHSE